MLKLILRTLLAAFQSSPSYSGRCRLSPLPDCRHQMLKKSLGWNIPKGQRNEWKAQVCFARSRDEMGV